MEKDVPRRYLLAPPFVAGWAFYPLLIAAALRAARLRAPTPEAAE